MATISPTDKAPADSVKYVFAGVEFELGGRRKKYDTTDPEILSNASTHPWLAVEYDKSDLVQGAYVEQLSASDDRLSRKNDKSNDPAVARAAEEEKIKRRDSAQLVGIDAGLKQTEEKREGPIAKTVAAADADSKNSDTPKDT